MNIVSFLAILCICIELWHIIYANWLYEKYFKYPESVAKWAESYGKLHKYFIEFSDYYTNNLELQYQLGADFTKAMLSVIDILQQVGGERSGRHKILDLCSMKKMFLFLLQQFIEILYWIIIFVLAFVMPHGVGVAVFVILWVISDIQKRFNQERKLLWLNVDSVLCILLFVAIICGF